MSNWLFAVVLKINDLKLPFKKLEGAGSNEQVDGLRCCTISLSVSLLISLKCNKRGQFFSREEEHGAAMSLGAEEMMADRMSLILMLKYEAKSLHLLTEQSSGGS